MKRSVVLLSLLTLVMYSCNLPASATETPAIQPEQPAAPTSVPH